MSYELSAADHSERSHLAIVSANPIQACRVCRRSIDTGLGRTVVRRRTGEVVCLPCALRLGIVTEVSAP